MLEVLLKEKLITEKSNIFVVKYLVYGSLKLTWQVEFNIP